MGSLGFRSKYVIIDSQNQILLYLLWSHLLSKEHTFPKIVKWITLIHCFEATIMQDNWRYRFLAEFYQYQHHSEKENSVSKPILLIHSLDIASQIFCTLI